MSRRKIDRYSYIDSLNRDQTKGKSFNAMQLTGRTKKLSVKRIEEIYKFLIPDGCKSDRDGFISTVKESFGTLEVSNNRRDWTFDIDGFMEYLLNSNKFSGRLADLGVDNYDSLLYLITHKNDTIPERLEIIAV